MLYLYVVGTMPKRPPTGGVRLQEVSVSGALTVTYFIYSCIQSNLRLRPPLVSDHLSSATSFPKYQKFPSQIAVFGTSCKRLPLVSDRDHF